MPQQNRSQGGGGNAPTLRIKDCSLAAAILAVVKGRDLDVLLADLRIIEAAGHHKDDCQRADCPAKKAAQTPVSQPVQPATQAEPTPPAAEKKVEEKQEKPSKDECPPQDTLGKSFLKGLFPFLDK